MAVHFVQCSQASKSQYFPFSSIYSEKSIKFFEITQKDFFK